MGNAVGRSRKAKVMKIDGETFKLKTPATANDVVKDYPGYVLLDSEAVKHFGLRAKPLEPHQELRPKRIYFLVELPKIQPEMEKLPRRARSSGIRSLNAKDRLELLMLSKRSVSDLTLVKTPSSSMDIDGPQPSVGPTRVKMRMPRTQLEKLVEESHDQVEVAEKIISLYVNNSGEVGGGAEEAKAEIGGRREAHRSRGVCFDLIIYNFELFIIFRIFGSVLILNMACLDVCLLHDNMSQDFCYYQ